MSATIEMNRLCILSKWNSKSQPKSGRINLMPGELTKLRAACEMREEPTKILFSKDFTSVPECLVYKNGKAYNGEKPQPRSWSRKSESKKKSKTGVEGKV